MNKVIRILRIFKSKTAKWLYWYCGIVFFFAVVYWCMFFYNSTSFFISEQLNKHVERYSLFGPDTDFASYHNDYKYWVPVNINDFNSLIKPKYDELSSINESLNNTQRHLNNCISKWDSLAAIADKNRSDSVQIFKAQELSLFQHKIDSLKEYIGERDSTQMIIVGKFVELAQLEYEYAKHNAKVCSYVLERWGSFVPDSIMNELELRYEERIQLSKEIETLESARRDISDRIREASVLFHNNRLESVSFWDFVYYSICVSTTTSFGDIAPNNAWTRRVTIAELLACMLLVAIIISKIKKNLQI